MKGVCSSRKQDRIVSQKAGNAVFPSPPGQRMVHPVVIQLAPEELLERFKTLETLKKVQNELLALQFWLWQFDNPNFTLAQSILEPIHGRNRPSIRKPGLQNRRGWREEFKVKVLPREVQLKEVVNYPRVASAKKSEIRLRFR
jgi:hypothetical protein